MIFGSRYMGCVKLILAVYNTWREIEFGKIIIIYYKNNVDNKYIIIKLLLKS